MNNLKLRIISLTMAAVSLITLSSCSLKKDNPYDDTSITSSMPDFSNIDDKFLRDTIIEFITTVNQSDVDIDWDWESFYSKIENTVFQQINDGFILGSYNSNTNIFSYQKNSKDTINHELMHVLLPYYENDCLNEGFNGLLLNEIFGYDTNELLFDVGMCKIFCRILTHAELKDFLSGNYDVLLSKLASIVPEYSDAEEFLRYLDDSNYYYRKLNESYFSGEFEQFKESDDYNYLKSTRTCIKGRIKIYLREFYSNPDYRDKLPEDELLEMFEVLDIVSDDLYDNYIDDNYERDYFLYEQVNNYSKLNNISESDLTSIDNKKVEYKYIPIVDKGFKK